MAEEDLIFGKNRHFFGGKGILDLTEQPTLADTLAAIYYHHFGSAITSQGFAGVFLNTSSENKLCRGIKCEIIHDYDMFPKFGGIVPNRMVLINITKRGHLI